MSKKEKEIILKYKIIEKEDIYLFYDSFVYENQKKCKIKINNIKMDLIANINLNQNDFGIKNYINNELEVRLIEYNNLTNLSDMFRANKSLISISNASNLVTSKITNIAGMFCLCESLIYLPDISKWNTSNITSMDNLFNFCSSLESLADISSWDTSNVENMESMFAKKLKSLPDISK